MASDDDIDELKAKRLCHQCVGEKYLGDEVQREGRRGQCFYCGRSARSYTIEEIAERVETAFEQHFRRTSDQPTSWQQSLLSDRESDYEWERDGEPVVWAIANAAENPERAAQDIQAILDDKYGDFDAAVHIKGSRSSSGDLTVTWIRRTRAEAEWRDLVDAPLFEDSERYEVEILDGETVVRTFTGLMAPTATYTSAEQVTDFGSEQAEVSVKVYQLSTNRGRGFPGEETV